MFGRRESLRELIRNQHAETLSFQAASEERYRQLVEETREFNREILLRNEKVYTKLIAEIEEGREQIRANTQAVLRLLDRFDEPGGATA